MSLLWIYLLRMLEAALLGATIGMERDIHGRTAGLRTNMVVSVGAALFTIVSREMGGGDAGRIAAQVVTGIGFIGAGTILQTGIGVRGLTTAACLWIVAAIGMACAIGLHVIAVCVTCFVVLSLVFLKKFETRLHRNYQLKIMLATATMSDMVVISKYLQGMEDVNVVALRFSVKNETNQVKADFTLDTNTFKNQSDFSMDVISRLDKHAELLKSYSVTCEN